MLLEQALSAAPRARLAALPTPIHPLQRLAAHLDGPELWIKRDDLTGLAGGGNKTRKLEFLVGEAIATGADTLVTIGAVQSNHTRQTAAAAARVGLRCALLHNGWAPPPGPQYRSVGNILLSGILGADLYVDDADRDIEDPGQLAALADHLRRDGRRPYVIPGGASDHPLGGYGYAACAAEIATQAAALGTKFDYVVHTTGSSSTQAGLLAGFAALGMDTRVIGIADDGEREVKHARVLRLANATLERLDLPARVASSDVEIVVADPHPYGVASEQTIEAIRLLARTEGLITDPVYEGKAVRGLLDLVVAGRLGRGHRVLLMHLGGSHAVHAWADRFWRDGPELVPFPAGQPGAMATST
jgi:1-aminocyclopropane-1-carboxylate deaminase